MPADRSDDDLLETMIRSLADRFAKSGLSVPMLQRLVQDIVERAEPTAPPQARAILSEIVGSLARFERGGCSEAELRMELAALATKPTDR